MTFLLLADPGARATRAFRLLLAAPPIRNMARRPGTGAESELWESCLGDGSLATERHVTVILIT